MTAGSLTRTSSFSIPIRTKAWLVVLDQYPSSPVSTKAMTGKPARRYCAAIGNVDFVADHRHPPQTRQVQVLRRERRWIRYSTSEAACHKACFCHNKPAPWRRRPPDSQMGRLAHDGAQAAEECQAASCSAWRVISAIASGVANIRPVSQMFMLSVPAVPMTPRSGNASSIGTRQKSRRPTTKLGSPARSR